MQLTINNVLGVKHAEIILEPGQVTEVVGPNASGKTSIAVATQALATRSTNPLSLSAADARKAYLHNGDGDNAFAELDDTTWWPASGTVNAPSGNPLSCFAAVGMVDFTGKRSAKEQAAIFQSVLLPPPETIFGKVEEHLKGYLQPDDLAGVMEMLRERGWDATESVYGDRARVAKREWQAIAGRSYGVKVASDWRPEGWQADYDHLTVQSAEAAVIDARDALNALHQVQAISAAEQEAAERAAQRLPYAKTVMDEAYEAEHKASADMGERGGIVTQRQNHIRQLESDLARLHSETQKVHECPHCGGGFVFKNGNVELPSDNPDGDTETIEAVRDEIDLLRNELEERLLPDLNQAKADHTVAVKLARDAAMEHGALEKAAARVGTVAPEGHEQAIARAEADVEEAKAIVDLVTRVDKADATAQTIARYTAIVNALGPRGIRAKLLDDGMRKLNGGLLTLAKTAGWPVVAVSDTGHVTMEERPIQLCSESERWRAQSSIQLTLGAIAGSKLVVLDRADLLDNANRQGLVAGLERVASKTGMAVLVCATGEVNGHAPWRQIAIAKGETA